MSEHTQALKVVRKYFPNVKNVEDGEQPIQVEVTRQDSNSAAVRNHEACAMAVACKRLTKAKGVIVSIGTAYIIKGETALRYAVPPPFNVKLSALTGKRALHQETIGLFPFVLVRGSAKQNPLARIKLAGNHGKPNTTQPGFAPCWDRRTCDEQGRRKTSPKASS